MRRSGTSSPEHTTATASPADAEELTRALEQQFYRIELGEQRRLMGVMEHHTGEGVVHVQRPADEAVVAVRGLPVKTVREEGRKKKEAFPFSITAGFEKGAKNRCVCACVVRGGDADDVVQVPEHLAFRACAGAAVESAPRRRRLHERELRASARDDEALHRDAGSAPCHVR